MITNSNILKSTTYFNYTGTNLGTTVNWEHSRYGSVPVICFLSYPLSPNCTKNNTAIFLHNHWTRITVHTKIDDCWSAMVLHKSSQTLMLYSWYILLLGAESRILFMKARPRGVEVSRHGHSASVQSGSRAAARRKSCSEIWPSPSTSERRKVRSTRSWWEVNKLWGCTCTYYYIYLFITLISSSPSAPFPKSPKESFNHTNSSSFVRKPFPLRS